MAYLSKQMTIEMEALRTYIVLNKLSGNVLQSKQGTLIDSVQATETVTSGAQVTGGVEAGGGPAYYGVFFEKGGTSKYLIVPKVKKALAFLTPDRLIVPRNNDVVNEMRLGFARGGSAKARAISKFRDYNGTVVAAVNHPPTSKLPFMAPSYEENKDGIASRLKRSVFEGLVSPNAD
jgi:hypothetical protein